MKLDIMTASMGASVASGLTVKVNMIIGLPGETHADIFASLRYIARVALQEVSDISIAPFAPYLGSELFELLNQKYDSTLSSDEFYLKLWAQTDLSQNYSWNKRMSSKQIGPYRIIGHALFYTLAMLRRPWRIFTTIKNVVIGKGASVLEKSIRD